MTFSGSLAVEVPRMVSFEVAMDIERKLEELEQRLSRAVLDGPGVPGLTTIRDMCARFQTPSQTPVERLQLD